MCVRVYARKIKKNSRRDLPQPYEDTSVEEGTRCGVCGLAIVLQLIMHETLGIGQGPRPGEYTSVLSGY